MHRSLDRRPSFPNIAAHLLAASVMNAPAGLLLSKMIRPEVDEPITKGTLHMHVEKTESNVIEAAAGGAAVGVQLAINVAAMLMAFVALVALLNFGLQWVGTLFGLAENQLSLQFLLGQALRPLAFVMGVPWQDTAYVGSLIGIKTALNEFVAYAQFASDLGRVVLSPKRGDPDLPCSVCLLLHRHPDQRYRRSPGAPRRDHKFGAPCMIAGTRGLHVGLAGGML
jgi:nucleoside permease NupC